MMEKPGRSVVFLSLVVGFLVAAAPSRRPSLDPSPSAILIRAEEGECQPEIRLIPEEGTVCSGAPHYAKGATDPSPVHSIPSPDTPSFENDRRQTVLSLINYPWQELGYDIVFMGARPGYRAMTLTAMRRIEVYVRPGESPMHQAFDLAHELGHAFDLKYNDEARRRKWCKLRGIKYPTRWFGCDACPDYSTPAGDFAETFAFLLLGPGSFHSLMAPVPTPDQFMELAAFCSIEHLNAGLTARIPKKTGPAAVHSVDAGKQVSNETKAEKSPESGKGPAAVRTVLSEETPLGLGLQDENSPNELPPLASDNSNWIQIPAAIRNFIEEKSARIRAPRKVPNSRPVPGNRNSSTPIPGSSHTGPGLSLRGQ